MIRSIVLPAIPAASVLGATAHTKGLITPARILESRKKTRIRSGMPVRCGVDPVTGIPVAAVPTMWADNHAKPGP
jgi:hypothetical protein